MDGWASTTPSTSAAVTPPSPSRWSSTRRTWRSRAPGRIPNIGLTLLGPTLVAFGTPELQERFIPPIIAGTEHWCQGYSEPNAGSDLANVSTRARLSGDRWLVTGQKTWTSLAQYAQWAFVLCRTDPAGERHAGLSYLLVPMDQPGVEVRPIVQVTGGSEFNEVFFDDAVTEAAMVVGGAGNGWAVAMGTLGFERGASTLGQQTRATAGSWTPSSSWPGPTVPSGIRRSDRT